MSGGLTKHLNILDYTLSSLWRRRMKNVSVLVVFAGVIFLVASFQLVTQALTETAARGAAQHSGDYPPADFSRQAG